jgi:hypothetical protein
MGDVIAALLVLLLVGGFVLFLVTSATRKSNVSDAGDPGAEPNPLSIAGADDESPAGSTDQHTQEHASGRFERGADEPDVGRPVVGGEGEGERSTRR